MVLTRIARGARRTSILLRYNLRLTAARAFQARPSFGLNPYRLRPLLTVGASFALAAGPFALPALAAAPSSAQVAGEDSLRPAVYGLPVADSLPGIAPSESIQRSLNQVNVGKSKETEEQEYLAYLREEQARKEREILAQQQKLEQERQAKVKQEALAQAAAKAAQAGASSQSAIEAISYWSPVYGVSTERMIGLAMCESSLRPEAINPSYYAGGGNPSGIFQFLPGTFYANAARAGVANPDIWNVNQQAQVAAYMISIGQARQWACIY